MSDKMRIEEQLQKLRFSVMAIIEYTKSHIENGSYKMEQLNMMENQIREKFKRLSDDVTNED